MKEKIYYYNGNLDVNSTINFEGEEFHHLCNVMRSKVGDKILLINGDGKFYNAEIKSIAKKYAVLNINKVTQSNAEPKIKITLFQALAKGEKLSLITQKISELGASELTLFESKFTDIKKNSHKPDRLEGIAISASKQCGRASILKINEVLDIKNISSLIKNYDVFYVAYENENKTNLVQDLLCLETKPKNVAIMIGAEGGFAEDEINILKNNGAKIVTLGSRILRTETAAISSVACISMLLNN